MRVAGVVGGFTARGAPPYGYTAGRGVSKDARKGLFTDAEAGEDAAQ